MIEEKLINGYKCRFQDSREAPECNFVSIPIVHDAKYNNVHFAIKLTPAEEETFGKRIRLVGSSTYPIKEKDFVVSIFTFAYMEDDDLEFIKRNVTFFFKERISASIMEDQTMPEDQIDKSNKLAMKLTLYDCGDYKIRTVKTLKSYLNMRLDETKNSIDSISITGYVDYDLSKLSISERKSLLANLRSNNVKYEVQ